MLEGLPTKEERKSDEGDVLAAEFLRSHRSSAGDVGVRLVLAGNEIQNRFNEINALGDGIPRETLREGRALSLVMKTIADRREALQSLASLREHYPQSATVVEEMLGE